MKVIVSRIPDELYDTLKEQLAQKGQTMDGYLKGLVFNDMNPEKKQTNTNSKENTRTICFRVPENEYKAVQKAALSENKTLKDFIKDHVSEDLNEERLSNRFESEDTYGRTRTVSFQADKSFFDTVKARSSAMDITFQDYMKSVIYSVTHQDQAENMSMTPSMGMKL